MKNFLVAIAILLILVAAFSTIESRVEFDYPFGNWAVPGDTGQPIPGEGEPGAVNTFSFGTEEQAEAQEETTDFCPITVEVVTEQKQEERQKESVLAWVLTGIAGVILAGCWVFIAHAYVQYFKNKRRKS